MKRESHLSIFTCSEQQQIIETAQELNCDPEELAEWIWEHADE